MKIIKADSWNVKVTPMEKFLTEKILQRCDYKESLSNQHRTTNGYIQVKELLNFATISKSRGKTLKSLKILLNEAKANHFKQSITNDIIIEKYFADLKSYINEFNINSFDIDTKNPNQIVLNKFIHKLKIFESQLDKGYFHALRLEVLSIDYGDSTHFDRISKALSSLVDLLIPYLVFKGYAVSSLSEIFSSWVEKNYRITADRIFYFFNFRNKKFKCLIDLGDVLSPDFEVFLKLLKSDQAVEIAIDKVGKLIKQDGALTIIDSNHFVAIYEQAALDPHMHVRTIYDNILKKVVQIKERQSLASFNDFFNNCYWRVLKDGKQYHKIELVNDPINVNSRSHTLRDTLVRGVSDFDYAFTNDNDIPIPKNKQLNNALYYYNLALGSKSIENSLSLLWTSLETIIPYRHFFSDIECVQHFVTRSLSLGSISRDIFSFAKRFDEVSIINGNSFEAIRVSLQEGDSQYKLINAWYDWILDKTNSETKFDKIKSNSELLAFEYARIGKPLATESLKVLKDRIIFSSDSIKYQLQRIYLHRNQIIHSGNLVNEYTNLWMHLEWYVGKLLAYSIINIEIIKKHDSLESVFIELESDYEYVTSYFERNSSKRVEEMTRRLRKIVLNYSWQSY